MWPVAILLIAVVQFYWFAFMFSIWCWLQAIVCLCQLKFVRGTIWFCLACGMLFWWMGTDIDFDTWLHGSATIVGLAVIATLLRYLNRILPPRKKLFKPRSPTGFGPKPPTTDNQLVVFSLHAKGEVSALAVVTRSRRKPQQRLCRPTSPLGRSDDHLLFFCHLSSPALTLLCRFAARAGLVTQRQTFVRRCQITDPRGDSVLRC